MGWIKNSTLDLFGLGIEEFIRPQNVGFFRSLPFILFFASKIFFQTDNLNGSLLEQERF